MIDNQSASERGKLLWALGLGGFLVNADNRAIAPMLPAIAGVFHMSASTAALLVTAYSIPYGLFQLVYGPIADRAGKVRTILFSLALFSLGTIACGIVHAFSWLLALRIITGMFAAGIIPTTLAKIGDLFALKERPRAIAFFMSLSTSGQAMGIVIGGLVAQFASYRILFLLLGIAAIPTLWTLRSQRDEEPAAGREMLPLRERYASLVRLKRAWLVYGLVFGEGFVFYAGFTFLGVYGVEELHLSYLVIGLLTATYSLGAFVGSRTITRVIGRLGSPKMPIFGAFLMTLGFASVWAWPSIAALTIGFVVLGLGFSYCHSTLQTYATDLLPKARATAVSVFAFCLFLGSGIGPVAAGSLYDRAGFPGLLGAVTIGMALFGCCCATLLREQAAARRRKAAAEEAAQ